MAKLSMEVESIVAYIVGTGVPVRVTATVGTYVSPTNPCSPHTPTSYHCATGTGGQGLAVDLAEPTASRNTPGLLKIFASFGSVESKLSELYYSGAPYGIKNGKRIVIPKSVRDTHWNHVHVAVPVGVFLVPMPIQTQGEPVPDTPPDYLVNAEPVGISAVFDSTGAVKGYYIICKDGGVFGFGTVPYLGRVHTA